MVEWMGVCLPMQTVWFEFWSKRIPHAMEQLGQRTTTAEVCMHRAHALPQESHCNEKRAHHNWRVAPARCN